MTTVCYKCHVNPGQIREFDPDRHTHGRKLLKATARYHGQDEQIQIKLCEACFAWSVQFAPVFCKGWGSHGRMESRHTPDNG